MGYDGAVNALVVAAVLVLVAGVVPAQCQDTTVSCGPAGTACVCDAVTGAVVSCGGDGGGDNVAPRQLR